MYLLLNIFSFLSKVCCTMSKACDLELESVSWACETKYKLPPCLMHFVNLYTTSPFNIRTCPILSKNWCFYGKKSTQKIDFLFSSPRKKKKYYVKINPRPFFTWKISIFFEKKYVKKKMIFFVKKTFFYPLFFTPFLPQIWDFCCPARA